MSDRQVAALIRKGRDFDGADQQTMLAKQHEIISAVLPAYRSAMDRGLIEISTSPFYHPILPLLCDSDQGRISSPGLLLPHDRFQHPEDASHQLQRGLQLHEEVFGRRPSGVWPSEGSISEEVFRLGSVAQVRWMASDEGVLGRTINSYFERTGDGVLSAEGAKNLYRVWRFEKDETRMHLVFRDHSLSDLIGFVYAGMQPSDAAQHFMDKMKKSCQAVLETGRDAVVPVILDGENAWEYYPESGREFLRALYSAFTNDPQIECLTVSEAIARTPEEHFGKLDHLVPGSWINSNFNVWIGSPEDNKSWDYLAAARDSFTERSASGELSEEHKALAFEELMISEGSDWNWWYGPEHHSVNDPEFDELYRKHLSNVYQLIGVSPPEHLAQPISTGRAAAFFTEQTAYIHPEIDGEKVGYFEWLGAAHYVADRRNSAMHGKRFLFHSAYAGIDAEFLYCRLDFTDEMFRPETDELSADMTITVNVERQTATGQSDGRNHRLDIQLVDGKMQSFELQNEALSSSNALNGSAKHGHPNASAATPAHPDPQLSVGVSRVMEMRISLAYLQAESGDTLQLRFSAWENQLPTDALPEQGAIAVRVITEQELSKVATGEHWNV